MALYPYSKPRIPGALVKEYFADSYPTDSGDGTFNVGDIVWNTAPTAGGAIGWVCVTAGSPGTWKAFGTIAS